MSSSEDWSDRKQRQSMPRDPSDVSTPMPPPKRLERMADTLKAAQDMLAKGVPPNPVRTGFVELDAGLKFLGPGEVTMLAADSGIGKSTLATQAIYHAAFCGHGGAYFNLEMSREMYGVRTVANFVGLRPKRVVEGKVDGDGLHKLHRGFHILGRPARHIVMGNASEHRTIPAIKKLCAEAARELEEEEKKLELVVVDHVLQIMVNVRNDKDAEGKARADLLKEIAETHKCHVLALVHITREGSKGGKMPTKNELASSAWFDRHADNILIFHQRRTADGTFEKGEDAILACQKARWGDPFAVHLKYRGGFFYPWSLRHDAEGLARAEHGFDTRAKSEEADAPDIEQYADGDEP